MEGKRYRIIRHLFSGQNREIHRGLTLEEAQEHCSREDTHGKGWFDGYECENPTDEDVERRIASDVGIERGMAELRKMGVA